MSPDFDSKRLFVHRAAIHPEDWAWLWTRIFGPDIPDDGRPLIILVSNSSATAQLIERHNARKHQPAP